MRKISVHILALAFAAFAACQPASAEVDDNGVPAQAASVAACASDPSKLGVSRVVEIDTTGGPKFGGEMRGHEHFLNDGEIVLTFDDGPLRAYTRRILQALSDHCTKATFFMVGRMAISDPAMVKEVAAAGHTIGTHTWSHQNLRATSLVRAKQQVESAISAVTKAYGGRVAPFFRFPYLSANKQIESYLQSRDISAMWIDVDSKDYLTRNPDIVKNRILAQLVRERKGIILMHDIQPSTAKMLSGLLDELHARGFKVVHVVPKAPVETIASFDEEADKAMAAKSAQRKNVASRSLVSSMLPDQDAITGDKTADEQKAKSSKVKKTSAKSSGGGVGIFPWSAETEKPVAPVKVKKKTQDEELPWQLNIFPN